MVETADGGFFVSEYGANRIARCNARGDKVATFGGKGRADGLLLGPQYMTIDSRGSLWVTDWGNGRVERFDAGGKFLQAITGITAPTGIAAHEDLLYVSEKSGRHILVFDLNGNPLSSIGDGTLNDPEGISFTPAGALLVADGNRILECDLDHETWTVRADTSANTKRLVQQVVTPNGNMLAVDFDGSLVVLLTDASTLYAGLVVRVDRINSAKFPEVYADVAVETRGGTPVMGLGIDNFVVSEARAGVKSPVIAQSNTAARSIDVALVVERSPDIETRRPDLQQAVADLYGLVTPGGRITAVSAAGKATREAAFGETRLRFIRQSLQAAPEAGWRFDLAAKLAGDELITAVSGAKRAIVFLSSGAIGQRGFSTYSLLETAAYMRNNRIAFYPVLVGAPAPDEDLTFLASETGGKVYSVSSPGGMQEVVREIRSRVTPVYTLRYTSLTPADFGDRYIPLEIEVTVQKVSGREESGYYAPPTTGLPAQ
jgi:sugar lactone lactonase YvrE